MDWRCVAGLLPERVRGADHHVRRGRVYYTALVPAQQAALLLPGDDGRGGHQDAQLPRAHDEASQHAVPDGDLARRAHAGLHRAQVTND